MIFGKKKITAVQLDTWRSPELKKRIEKQPCLAIVPVGAFEQHGPHAPLGTDTYISFEISRRLAKEFNGVVLPPIWCGISEEHMDFSGTISLRPETFYQLITDIVFSLVRTGITKIVLLNGHGGNGDHLQLVAGKLQLEFGDNLKLVALSYWELLEEEEKDKFGSFTWGFHANQFETSIIAYIYPDLVVKTKEIDNFPNTTGVSGENFNKQVFKELMKNSNGVWGEPSKASIKIGKEMLEKIVDNLTEHLKEQLV
jgi:creatinine amidohydrolase